jgi:predicted flap endonuclease-1-like 5' DNA nuclease
MCAEQQLITNAKKPMFTEPVSKAYDMSDATLEIALMLLGAFILGWLFRHIFGVRTPMPAHESSLVPAVQTPRAPMVVHAPYKQDDLKAVEGIGPKIETLLKAHGIKTWGDLAKATPTEIREILARGGERFALANPESWPDQAALARDGRWDDLKNFQSVLDAGRMS